VKLDNLILDDQGRLHLIDFGVARRRDAPLALTRPGVAMGTLRMMAPEQHAGEEADERTDVYAAGLVLFELVTGRGPFDHLSGNAAAMRAAHCGSTPPLPSWCAPQSVPSAVEAVVTRALAKRAEDRFASARAMATALRDTAGYENIEGPTFVDPSMKGGAA